jgi:serine/threonine-protein kinase
MEYADGETVQERIDARGPFGEATAVGVALAVAEALGHIHRHGLIHRDLKPANIILTRDGGVKLIDFGLARPVDDAGWAVAEAGNAIGTPESISPEQTRGQVDVDVRGDIYGLGAILYHMVTGRPAYSGTTHEVIRQHADPRAAPVPPREISPSLSAGLAAVIARMMAKNREDRYRDPDELVADLDRLRRGEPPRLAASGAAPGRHGSPADGESAGGGAAGGDHARLIS